MLFLRRRHLGSCLYHQYETQALVCTVRLVVIRPSHRRHVKLWALSSQNQASDVPWSLGFQLNERYLLWNDNARMEFNIRFLAHQLDQSVEDIQQQLQQLANLLPDMVSKLEITRVDILLELLRDLEGITSKVLSLRELLPGINVSLLISRNPKLWLLDWSIEKLQQRLVFMRGRLPGVNVSKLLDREPMLLHVDLDRVLANAKRLMPEHDPVRVLVAQPQMLLDMVSAGLPSAVDVEGSPDAPA